MNKLVESVKRGDGFLLFSVCTELMNNYHDTSGVYDRLSDGDKLFLLDVLQCRVKNWKYYERESKSYDVSVLLLVIEVLKLYDIFVFGTAILNDHPIWKYGCKLVDKNV